MVGALDSEQSEFMVKKRSEKECHREFKEIRGPQ